MGRRNPEEEQAAADWEAPVRIDGPSGAIRVPNRQADRSQGGGGWSPRAQSASHSSLVVTFTG